MADALISFALEQLASIINLQDIQKEVRLVVGVDKEVEKLTTTLTAIQAVLSDAERKQIKDQSVKLWLQNLKNIIYEMDDVLDEWKTKILRSQMEGLDGDKVSSNLSSLGSSFKNFALRRDTGFKIQKIRKRLDFIASEKDKYRLVEIKSIPEDSAVERPIKTTSIIDASDLFGRDLDKDTILSQLLGDCSNENSHPYIISITGMGGLGKTTLAQLVFNDDKVKTHFEKTMWVCVSDPFDLVRVAKAIIKGAGQSVPDSPEWDDALHCRLGDSVKGKRFLLVLDDVWTDDHNKWNPLKLSLNRGAKGSRILVTTRNENVALMMDATYKHRLGLLSDDDCWSLLTRIAFAGRKKEELQVLKEIGIKIAKKCKGLPLAAKTLGSMLKFKRTKQDWSRVFNNEIWKLEEVEENLIPALWLSYYDLPSPLKTCFTYCAIFPKDHKIEKDRLIRLWMAQGFLNSRRRDDLESIGEEYFNHLAMRSFFQDFDKGDDGSIQYCKMHDLVHDFAQFLTENECHIAQEGEPWLSNYYSGKASHLTLGHGFGDLELFSSHASSYKNEKLRTLQVLHNGYLTTVEGHAAVIKLFHHLRRVRVLCLEGVEFRRVPSEIKNLIHLRYIDFSRNRDLMELPDSMCSLYNLQTLKLNSCWKLQKLPKGMGRMIRLRHLEIEDTVALTYLPKGVGKLSSLQTLSRFIVDDTSAGCKINELKDLNLLQGHLVISGLGKVKTTNEASEAKLDEKQQLRGLTLEFPTIWDGIAMEERGEGILGFLQPHPNLVHLTIDSYLGNKFPNWMSIDSTLTQLRQLILYQCTNCIKLPALGQLPSLEVLQIQSLTRLKHIGADFYGIGGGRCVNKVAFPKLKTLVISFLWELEIWDLEHEEVEEIMPCVNRIILMSCLKLKVLPALGKLPSLRALEIKGGGKRTDIGHEFYGLDSATTAGGQVNQLMTSFPKLTSLRIESIQTMGEWNLGLIEEKSNGREITIMPCLQVLEIAACCKLKTLRGLDKLPSLKKLKLDSMGSIEEFKPAVDAEGEEFIMPCLKELFVDYCPNLKSLPHHLPELNHLTILRCPSLLQLPFSPNLTNLTIKYSSSSPMIPQGIAQFKNLRYLCIIAGISVMRIPEDVLHLNLLQELHIEDCWPTMKERCRKDVGEDWHIISHIPKIHINGEQIQ